MSRTTVLINLLDDNPWQVREVYDPAYLEDLAADILKNGLLQPPLARMHGNGILSYQLAFGHCRLRAYKLLHTQGHSGFDSMPVEVRQLTDEQMADFAWTENEQRRNVTPIERMHAIKKQMETFGWTQKEIAERRGLSEATVSNILRLGQLPEDVQSKVHTGDLSERAALPLITYFNLPETVRNAAAKKAYIPDPVKYAKEGKASDDIRQAVNSVVQNMATSLKDIPLAQAFEGDGIITATCQACANLLTYNQQPYCGEQTRHCFSAKTALLEAQRREQAAAESGLAFIAGDESIRKTFSYGDASVLPFAKERQCEHLRLNQPGYHVRPEEALDLQRFPGIRIVCCNPNGACVCASALRDTQPQEPYTPSPELLARQQAQQEEQARQAALVDHFRKTLSLPTQAAFLDLLDANDVRAWRLLLNEMTNKEWREIEPLTLEQCYQTVADHLIDPSNWAITRDPDTAVARLNLKRTRLGLEPLELPEPENTTPAEKLLRRLERLEGWLERTAEGEEDITVEAVRGNVDNLEKIKAEYATLPASDDDRDFFLRINAHLDYLHTWLVEYDAESDEQEDEDEEALAEETIEEAKALAEAYA